MAESTVAVTEGAGKKLHSFNRTIGANSVEDEVVLLGENYLASYMLTTQGTNVSTATANSHLLQIMAGASLKVRIRRIEMHQLAMATTVTVPIIQLFRLTTAGTGGTTLTPAALDPGDSASGATAMTLPSSKGTEGVQVGEGRPYLMQTLSASTPLVNPVWVMDFDRPRSKPLIISSGTANGIAVKIVTATAAATVAFNVWLDESSF